MKIMLQINRGTREVQVESSSLLADVLRDECRLTSIHLGCEHGVCGACNVIVDGNVVRSCLTLAASSAGQEIRTLEGMDDEIAIRLKSAFSAHHALQCGFCTPGMMVTAYDIVRSGRTWSESEIRQRLSGNICRCTGYQGIVAAISEVADSVRLSNIEVEE